MTTLDDREQRQLSKRCTQCGEVRPLEEFPRDKSKRDGRKSRCRVCNAKHDRERRWAKKGIPESAWPRLHQEVEARATRRNSIPNGFKVCARCNEAKPLEEFPPDKRKRDGRDSWCHVCHARRCREAYWAEKGIPESEWPRLHQEVDTRAARRDSIPDGLKRCSRCDEVKPLAEFSPDQDRRDGRRSECRVCDAKRSREARWAKRGIPPEEWPRLHEEVGRKAEARTKRPVERQRIMRELAKQHGLKYCPDCDMCLGKAFFHRDSRSADGLQSYCKACTSARHADYSHTPAGRAAKRGCQQRRRARERGLPTDGTGPRDWAAHMEEINDFQCHLCGGDLTEDDEIHWDHLDPISTGTTGTVFHNMHAAHAECNLRRGNRTLEEWFAATGLLDVTV